MKDSTIKLAQGILSRKRDCLARAITLIESSRFDHQIEANHLLNFISIRKQTAVKAFAKHNTFRLGIAGPPGAGKSSFIENLGTRLIKKSHRVAVVPVDPSSHVSGGSILGDKTRMDMLSREDNAYIRASPTSGVLGGIAEHTSDVITLCEAASYDTVIIESVGIGQSEVDIDRAVDMLILIIPPGGGDGLQASKKGIMEAADLVLVNKADGNLLAAARSTKSDYASSIQFIRQKHRDWRCKALLVSAATGLGMDTVEEEIAAYHAIQCDNGELLRRRSEQAVHWMWGQLRRQAVELVEGDQAVQQRAGGLLSEVGAGRLTPRAAAADLLRVFKGPTAALDA